MPEIAEVAIVAQQLQPLIKQRLLTINPQLDGSKQIINQPITDVLRRGKYFALAFNDYILEMHLRMTGRILLETDVPSPQRLADKHLFLELSFTDNKLLFYDPRRFATAKVIKRKDFAANAGRDLWESLDNLPILTSNSSRAVKAVLLDQTVVAGIGNYLADEGLWSQQIHPLTKWKDLSYSQRLDLLTEIQTISKQAFTQGGVSVRDYVAADGKQGTAQLALKCYGRAGQPCLRCSCCLVKTKVAGRGTTYCVDCQQL